MSHKNYWTYAIFLVYAVHTTNFIFYFCSTSCIYEIILLCLSNQTKICGRNVKEKNWTSPPYIDLMEDHSDMAWPYKKWKDWANRDCDLNLLFFVWLENIQGHKKRIIEVIFSYCLEMRNYSFYYITISILLWKNIKEFVFLRLFYHPLIHPLLMKRLSIAHLELSPVWN